MRIPAVGFLRIPKTYVPTDKKKVAWITHKKENKESHTKEAKMKGELVAAHDMNV
jgi:hypothetical protein